MGLKARYYPPPPRGKKTTNCKYDFTLDLAAIDWERGAVEFHRGDLPGNPLSRVGFENVDILFEPLGYLSLLTWKTVRDRGGTWAVYVNHAMDSSQLGNSRCLQFGEGCTVPSADALPTTLPDTRHGPGWAFQLLGEFNLTTGEVTPIKKESHGQSPVGG